MIASIGTAGTLVIEAIGVVVTIVGIWLAGSPERRKRKVRDQRIDDGLFGYREGDTKKPGIFTTVDTIEGDVAVVRDLADAAATLGSDNKTSLIAIEDKVDKAADLAKVAADKSQVAVVKTAKALTVIRDHVSEDLNIHEEQRVALNAISDKVGSRVKLTQKKAAPKKAAAKKAAPTRKAVKK